MYTTEEVKEIIKNYSWMSKAVKREANDDSMSNLIKNFFNKIKFIEKCFESLNNDRDKYILELLFEGYTYHKVAKCVRLHQSQVSKRVERMAASFSSQ